MTPTIADRFHSCTYLLGTHTIIFAEATLASQCRAFIPILNPPVTYSLDPNLVLGLALAPPLFMFGSTHMPTERTREPLRQLQERVRDPLLTALTILPMDCLLFRMMQAAC